MIYHFKENQSVTPQASNLTGVAKDLLDEKRYVTYKVIISHYKLLLYLQRNTNTKTRRNLRFHFHLQNH